MGTLERTETLSHRIGADGRVSVKTVTGSIKIRGIDGDEARLSVTYRIRADSQGEAERLLDGNRVIVDRSPASLEVETPERRLASGIAWLFGGARVGADLALEVPWEARVRLETVNGTIESVGLVGEQKYRTVSGDVRTWNLAGNIDAGTLSGSFWLDGGSDVRMRVNTVSGSVRVRAARIHGMLLSSTSGAISVAASLDPAGDHRAESISGSVELFPLSGVTAELRSVTGSIATDAPGRVDGSRGFWRAVVGDGGATLRVSSTSGSLRIGTAGAAGATGQPPAAPAAPVPPVPPAPPAAPVTAWDPAPASPGQEVEAAAAAEAVAAAAADPAVTDDELAVLRALERGEIGVDEASARLETIRGRSDV